MFAQVVIRDPLDEIPGADSSMILEVGVGSSVEQNLNHLALAVTNVEHRHAESGLAEDIARVDCRAFAKEHSSDVGML